MKDCTACAEFARGLLGWLNLALGSEDLVRDMLTIDGGGW
jgi:hypothetical protein